jgi:ribosomal protein S18 acetylase RimI-like enzyme
VAAELLAEAASQVKAKGFESAWLAVASGNSRARRFYERQGWSDEGPFEYAARTGHGTIAVPCHRFVKELM